MGVSDASFASERFDSFFLVLCGFFWFCCGILCLERCIIAGCSETGCVQVPFPVPLEVNVILVGFLNDGGYRFKIDHDKLYEHMKQTFPTHRPACMETGEVLDIEFDMSYNVIPVRFKPRFGILAA